MDGRYDDEMITVIALNHGSVVNPRSPKPYFMFRCIAADDAGRNRWPDLDRAHAPEARRDPASGHRRNDVSPHRILHRRTLLRVRPHQAHRTPPKRRRASHSHPAVSHANEPRSTPKGNERPMKRMAGETTMPTTAELDELFREHEAILQQTVRHVRFWHTMPQEG